MATEKRLISVTDCPCDGCKAKPCGHPARCVKFALWLNKTVDAVEVVRCKDCKKWYRHTEVDRERGKCNRYQTTKHETGYCDRGERKDNDL